MVRKTESGESSQSEPSLHIHTADVDWMLDTEQGGTHWPCLKEQRGMKDRLRNIK